MSVDALARALFAASPSKGGIKTSARAAVADVYDAHADYVWRCLRSLGVRDASLDDAVQDVFLVVHAKLADFDGRAQVRTWLYAIVLRVARRHRERHARDAARNVDQESIDSVSLEHTLLARDELGLAQRALQALDAAKREVFVLAEIEQLTAAEISEITGAPLNTVYSRLRAARAAFEQAATRLSRATRNQP
jgi:RNA polymerase sigma-70 factor (ECF subfamily)